jgi:hypothetical protein
MTEVKVKRIMLIATISSVTMLTLLAIGGLFVITKGPHARTLPMLRTEVASVGSVTPSPQETAPAFLTDDAPPDTGETDGSDVRSTGDPDAGIPAADPAGAQQPQAAPAISRKAPSSAAGSSSGKTTGQSRTTSTSAPTHDSSREHAEEHDEDDDEDREVIGPDVRETDRHGE